MSMAEARLKVDEFIHQHHGENEPDPKVGRIVVDEGASSEYGPAYVFSFNTERFFETRHPFDGILLCVVVVPKDGAPPHWPPQAERTDVYLDKVANGEMWWSNDGAGVNATVTYWGVVDPADPDRIIGGVMRRRTVGDRTVDESFRRDLRWRPTEFLRRHELGHDHLDLVELYEDQAGDFVRAQREKQSPSEVPDAT